MWYVKNKLQISVLGLLALALGACADKSADISILSDSDTFYQSASVNNKIDIMWMVDSSGSMEPYQQNLADNFSSFISDFVTKGYDFQMAVAGTDGWIRETNYRHSTCGSSNNSENPNTRYYSSADCNYTHATYGQLTHFRDGDIYGTQYAGSPGVRSGTYLITSVMTPANIISLFQTNVKVGIRGDGSERGFQSLRGVLRRNESGGSAYGSETHTALSSFRRPEAFMAVIVVADEDDLSVRTNGSSYSSTTNYKNAFMSFMDGYTNSTEGNRKYNVSAIVVEDDNNCPGMHSSATEGRRYMSVADASDGVVGSICDSNFSSKLSEISSKIVELSTRFKLSREPIPSSIVVKVNSVEIPNNPSNGWTYLADSGHHFVVFHGSATPPQGAPIQIDFDPVSLN